MNEETVVVSIHRRIARRPTGDSVVHWEARIAAPACMSQGRSLDRIERSLRRRLASRPDWSEERASAARLVFELRDAPAETQDLLAMRTRALATAQLAVSAAHAATDAAIGALLVGTPALSVRDVARFLGLPKMLVQRVAAAQQTAVAGKRSRELERTAALEARIPPGPYATRRKMMMERRKNAPLRNPAGSGTRNRR